MSAIRAKVNCERCYRLANIVKGSPDEGIREAILRNSQIYEARNEALRGLEDGLRYLQNTYIRIKLSSVMKEAKKIVLQGITESARALEACGSCDYSSPRIAEVFKKRGVLKLLLSLGIVKDE